jgi:hypothetical protein
MPHAADDLRKHEHAVKFYGTDQSLFDTVATFLGEGLAGGHPAIILATPPHRQGILEGLEARLIDVRRAQEIGSLVVRDAETTLDLLLVEGQPDPTCFEEHVGGLLGAVEQQHPGRMIRAYGEMVNILWTTGQADAAITLEMFWNRLAMTRRFALICGYAMGQFYKQSAQYETVCKQHSHVVEPDTNVVTFPPRRSRRSA